MYTIEKKLLFLEKERLCFHCGGNHCFGQMVGETQYKMLRRVDLASTNNS
jgi:hypothetical protein